MCKQADRCVGVYAVPPYYHHVWLSPEWMAATPLTAELDTTARYAMFTCLWGEKDTETTSMSVQQTQTPTIHNSQQTIMTNSTPL